jgi:hypothetical protein
MTTLRQVRRFAPETLRETLGPAEGQYVTGSLDSVSAADVFRLETGAPSSLCFTLSAEMEPGGLIIWNLLSGPECDFLASGTLAAGDPPETYCTDADVPGGTYELLVGVDSPGKTVPWPYQISFETSAPVSPEQVGDEIILWVIPCDDPVAKPVTIYPAGK